MYKKKGKCKRRHEARFRVPLTLDISPSGSVPRIHYLFVFTEAQEQSQQWRYLPLYNNREDKVVILLLEALSSGAELEKKIVGGKIKLCIELRIGLLEDRGQIEN